MKKNKLILAFILVFTVTITMVCNVWAIEMVDSTSTTSVYKASEDTSDFSIPFVRISEERMDIDTSISQLGVFISYSSIEVNQPLNGIQLYYTSDTVRINSDIDYAAIFAAGSVIINSTVEDTVVIFSNSEVTINEEANIKGNIIVYASKINVNGEIEGNLIGYADAINVNNTISGTIRMSTLDATFAEGVQVLGGVEISTSNESLQVAESVGDVNIEISQAESSVDFSYYATYVIKAALTNFVLFLIIVLFIKKDKMDELTSRIQGKNILKNGVLTYIGVIISICIAFVLLIPATYVAIAVLVFAIAILVVFTLIKNLIVGTAVAKLIEKKYVQEKNNKVITIIGSIVAFALIEILELIPYVGDVLSFIIFIIAVGIVVSLITKPIVSKVINTKKNDEDNNGSEEVIKVD